MTSERLQEALERSVADVLKCRPRRPSNGRAHLHALSSLAQLLEASPSLVLSRAVELVVSLGMAQSAGLSLVADETAEGLFRWHAVDGDWAQHVGR